MPIISMFYGIIVYMYALDTKQHHLPHIHVEYQGMEAVISIPSGDIIVGEISTNKMKLLQAWIEIHREELIADWAIAVKGGEIFRIDPLH
jgi:Domain of unknown function (DUF4160)